MNYKNENRTFLGVDVRARSIYKGSEDYDAFKSPIIHKKINGEVIVPLDVVKLWGEQNFCHTNLS